MRNTAKRCESLRRQSRRSNLCRVIAAGRRTCPERTHNPPVAGSSPARPTDLAAVSRGTVVGGIVMVPDLVPTGTGERGIAMAEVTGIECIECGLALDEDPRVDAQAREPCPNCGSKGRKVFVLASETVTMHASTDLKQRRPGEPKPTIEQREGQSCSTSRDKWMEHSRRIDRGNDQYDEVVVDPETGEIVHEDHSPLTEHRGHGSDKVPHRQTAPPRVVRRDAAPPIASSGSR